MLFLALVSALAFYVAWNLGANDVANSMGTSVGSKAVTLGQALVIAGVLEFLGAVLFSHQVSATLATDVIDLSLFVSDPQVLMWGMVSALIACGLWLQTATSLGLPVASSHAVVGAIAGFGSVAVGIHAVNWSSIGLISLTWVLTPLISGAIAFGLYSLIRHWILEHPHPLQQLAEWIPWLSAALVSIFGIIVLPTITERIPLVNELLPVHDAPIAIGAIAVLGLTLAHWHQLKLTVAAPSASSSASVEQIMARFQVLSACFVAFAHGSNDVGNAIAPLAAIVHIHNTQTVPLSGLAIPLWVLLVGGVGIVSGLAILGKNVIRTIGEGIIALQPSGGFCAELAAATTILLASRWGLPVSTSHALVGGVVGIGLVQMLHAQKSGQGIQLQTIRQIALAWVVTIPIVAFLSAGIFVAITQIPQITG